MATKTDPSADKPKTSRPKKQADNYNKPDMRQQIKQQISADDKGGKPGQWSALKAQRLTHENQKAGGGYRSDQWTDQAWQTTNGKPAQRAGGTTRYLPKEAWEELSPAEQKATNDKKLAGSKTGEQVVANTKKAKMARKKRKPNALIVL